MGADLSRVTHRGRRNGVDRRWLRGPRTPGCVGRKRGIQCNALGRSRGGFSTKIHAIVDAKGRPLHVTLTPGERHEMVAARELADHARGPACIADTGYDSHEFRAELKARGIKPVIHSKPERKRALPLDRKLYRIRYLVEVCFHELKRFRAIGTRYDKTKVSFLALLQVACICLWLT
ncbi:MAG: IS5 family transposase [Kofleriaceae bacterium]|nr:IS5 family transposase [Kofleriaceae bacterium]